MHSLYALTAAPVASLTSVSGSEGTGVAFIFVLFMLAVGSVLFLIYAGRRQTIVVVEQSSGLSNFLTFLIAIGVIVVFLVGSGSGLT